MKKITIIAMVCMGIFFTASISQAWTVSSTVTVMNSNQQKKEKAKKEEVKIAKTQYACPMHPKVVSEKPGKCSKCKMNLVKVEDKKSNSQKK